MQVTALKEFPYGAEKRKIGDTFEMSDADALLMIGFGKVKSAVLKEVDSAASPAADDQKSRRSYRRRDMFAEGSQRES